MKAFYQLSIEETVQQLKSSGEGLKSDVITVLQTEYGSNELQKSKQKSRWKILLDQFTDVMIVILIIAAIISFISGEQIDAYVILAIIIGNAWLGYSQEYNAEKSITMLQQMAPQFATVLRNNNPAKIEAR